MFFYYRDGLEPLEQPNAQVTSLIEIIIDLIDGGNGERSLQPPRIASEMVSVMLTADVRARPIPQQVTTATFALRQMVH